MVFPKPLGNTLAQKNRAARVVNANGSEYGTLSLPHARHLEGKLWELRIDGRPNSYRVVYAAVPDHKFLLLHAFAKKSQRTPPQEIAAARRRLSDYLERKAK